MIDRQAPFLTLRKFLSLYYEVKTESVNYGIYYGRTGAKSTVGCALLFPVYVYSLLVWFLDTNRTWTVEVTMRRRGSKSTAEVVDTVVVPSRVEAKDVVRRIVSEIKANTYVPGSPF